MAKTPPEYERYIDATTAPAGFSGIALGFWRAAEKLRDDAEKQTAGQDWRVHWSIHSAICLHHAALECFINEEIAICTAGLPTGKEKLLTDAYRVQGDTLSVQKIDGFWSLFGLEEKVTPDIKRRVALLSNLRNRLYHHWPLVRDVRDYPAHIIEALNDAQIERINTSWAAQCSDIRLAQWSARVVRGFVDEWWRIGRGPAEIERIHWEYGPDWRYPSEQPAGPTQQQNLQ